MTVLKLKGILSKPWWDHVHRFIAVFSLIAAITVYYQQKNFTDCIAAYNDAQSSASGQRAEAVEGNFRAIDQMVKDVTSAKSGADTRAALEKYLKARAEADQQRADHPLPAPPSQRCE